MNTLIVATLTVTFVYFSAGLIAHIHDAIAARRQATAPIDYFPEADEDPSDDEILESLLTDCAFPCKFRPAPVVATANLYQQCNIRQLKKFAKGRVKNYSSLTKPQLIAALS